MTSPNVTLLIADFAALSKEAGRRNADVREAADKAHGLLKSAKEQTILDLRSDPPPSPQPLYQPIFIASATRNPKVIALAVSSLQRLISAGLVPQGLVTDILETLEQVIPQGVEIQLKVLQTLVSLLTTTIGGSGENAREKLVQGEDLGQALELSHRLSTSKIPVVASTASATLRQLFMFVFERVGEEDASVAAATPEQLANLPPASFILDVPPPEHDAAAEEGGSDNLARDEQSTPTSISLRPAARDAYLLLEDLCLLISRSADGGPDGEPSFLRWGVLSRTFGLELVESIVSGFGAVVRNHPELLLVLRAHLCPLLIRFLSSPPSSSSGNFSFPLTLRLTRVIFLLLKQFSDLLPLESEVFLCMFVRVIGPGEKGDGDGGHPAGPGAGSSPLWMRVLALEIFRGLCGDFNLMVKFYERYDAMKKRGGGGSSVFSDLMMAFNRLATEKPGVLGVGAAVIYGSSLSPISGSHSPGYANGVLGGAAGMIDSAMEMGLGLAHVATSVVGTSVGAGAIPAGLSLGTASLKLQCIDQLDKAEAPPIPDTYVFLLALQCLTSLSDGFATQSLSKYTSILSSQRKAGESAPRSPAALDWSTVDKSDPKVVSLLTIKDMAEASWPALLASLSFFISTALDDDLFGDVVTALQNFTSVCGVLGLQTPREAFLTSLCKFAIPPAVVSHITSLESMSQLKTSTSVLSAGVESLGLGPAAPLPVGLSSRNFACLKALISVAQYLAGSLDATWFAVFETLQNADFVIKANASRANNAKKRGSISQGAPSSPAKSVPSPLSPNLGSSSTSAVVRIPVQPTEADETAIQNSILKLFEVSRGLENEAFKWFVGALCRLNGEMIGIPMMENGQVAEIKSAPALPSPGMDGPPGTPGGRRRSSGISSNRTLRLGEKSFGVSKLGVISQLNVHRMIYSDAAIGWDLVISHLLLVQHYAVAPPAIRLQAAEVLDEILIAAPKDLVSGGEDLQRRIQTQVLAALAEQAEPAMRIQSTTDVEIRRMALDTLFKILENSGHSFIAGWDRIFPVLRTACPSHLAQLPSSPGSSHALDTIDEEDSPRDGSFFFTAEKPARTPILVRTSFPSLQLICTDFLAALTIDELRECIGTLADFGRQADDVNVALTAGGLLWGVSDHLQGKRKDGDNELAHGELWMFLLHQLLILCQDSRQEVRDGAITTTFRSISLYGSTLTKATWDACMFEIIFPLVEGLSTSIAANNTRAPTEGEEVATQANGPPIRLVDKQWDDSKTLALSSIGVVVYEFLPRLLKTSRFDETWSTFISLLKRSFIEDRPPVATIAMQAIEKALSVVLDVVEQSRIASAWEVAWAAWDDIGHAIVATSNPSPRRTNSKTFTQVNLEAYVKVILPIYNPAHLSFDLTRISRLLAILKSVLTFARSPDYRPDVDSLTSLQAVILEAVAIIDLSVAGAPSAVLSDLTEYITLAFVGAFDAEPEDSNGKLRTRIPQRVTYIALSKEVMPHLVSLFQKYADDISVYEAGAVERLLSAYSLPMKLKYDCPAPSKYGSDEPLWKTATINFLRAVKDIVNSLQTLATQMTPRNHESIWKQIVEGYRGALLAENDHEQLESIEDRRKEENFDLALLISLEQDILPYIGHSLVPDDLIQRLAKYIQSASRLYELDLPPTATSAYAWDEDTPRASISETKGQAVIDHQESRFDTDFDRQASGGTMFGTTAEVCEIGRERFGYWCLELLFLMCSQGGIGHEVERRRIASLSLPYLMNRCKAAIKAYVVDAPLRGKMPFPRVRQEELIFLLQNLLSIRLIEGSLHTSTLPNPSDPASPLDTTLPLPLLIRSALLRSPIAHLYELHPLFTDILALSTTSPSITSAYIPYRNLRKASIEEGQDDQDTSIEGLPEGFSIRKIGHLKDVEVESQMQRDVVVLTLACLRLIGGEIGSGAF